MRGMPRRRPRRRRRRSTAAAAAAAAWAVALAVAAAAVTATAAAGGGLGIPTDGGSGGGGGIARGARVGGGGAGRPLPTFAATAAALAAAAVAAAPPAARVSRRDRNVFVDVTAASGLPMRAGLKYGGPLVADLNDDGVYDLVLPQHNEEVPRVCYGRPGGTYQPGERLLPYVADVHGIAAGDTTLDGKMDLLVTLGGAFGREPQPPVFYRRTRRAAYKNSTAVAGLDTHGGRGRSPRFVDLDGDGDLDLILFHYIVLVGPGPRQVVYENVGGGAYKYRPNTGLQHGTGEQLLLTDMDGDGQTDIISFPWFRIYRRVAPFQFVDDTTWRLRDLPGPAERLFPTFWVAELDFDNDGRWDLYLVRGSQPDVLLRNVGGHYTDVTAAAGLTDWASTTGATVADFDNDGYEDILVSRTARRAGGKRPPDVLYWNRGDGTFERVTSHGAWPPWSAATATGDAAQAYDADGDGRVDVLVGYGDRDNRSHAGPWRLYRNTLPWCGGCATKGGGGDGGGGGGGRRRAGHWLSVRVRRNWRRTATAAGAVVTVTAGGVTRRRRVGPAGASNHQSQLSVVHFGLGAAAVADSVRVRWSDGSASRAWTGVAAGQLITIGR